MADKHRVMVVDDDPDIRKIIKHILAPRYETVFAHDGVDALDKLDTHEPDLFLLDVAMPVMDGFRACAAIRRHPRFRSTHVIFVSVMDDPEKVRKAYEIGGNYFIGKPVDPSRLLRNLEISLRDQPPPAPKQFTIEQLEALETRKTAPRTPAPPAPAQTPARPPVARPAPVQPAPPGTRTIPAAPSASVRARVMIVDDDPDIRFVISKALEGRFEVITANDGYEAVTRMMEIEPDLLILDINMPRMDGFQVCASLRRTRRFHDTPVIFLSASAAPDSRAKAKRAGATDFVGKPCSFEEVVAAIDAAMDLPTFSLRPKRRRIEELLDAEDLYEFKRHLKAAETSVSRDYGAFQRFIEENFMSDLGKAGDRD